MLNYPVYAILEDITDDGHVYSALNRRVNGELILPTALFTSVDKAVRWQAGRGIEGQLKSFGDPVKLWTFVQSFRPPTYEVAFDPEESPQGLKAESFSVMDFIDRFLPTVRFWDYPVYVVKLPSGGFSCLSVSAEGRSDMLMLPFFTDIDLAERFISAKEPQGVATSIDTPMEFIHLISVIEVIQGVVEDPGTSGGNFAQDRATILRNLQASIEG